MNWLKLAVSRRRSQRSHNAPFFASYRYFFSLSLSPRWRQQRRGYGDWPTTRSRRNDGEPVRQSVGPCWVHRGEGKGIRETAEVAGLGDGRVFLFPPATTATALLPPSSFSASLCHCRRPLLLLFFFLRGAASAWPGCLGLRYELSDGETDTAVGEGEGEGGELKSVGFFPFNERQGAI